MAGVAIKVDDLCLDLLKCQTCGYYFVHPAIPVERLSACYKASSSKWNTNDDISDLRSYAYKRKLLSAYAPNAASLLNVGCYDGGFENFLGDDYECYGVEPSVSAAALAEERGVTLLGETVDDLKVGEYKFDIVILFDVAEHFVDPVRVFGKVVKCLSPDGIIMFETGDMDSFPWQDKITLNPYCAVYDHVGFFSKSSVERLTDILGLELLHFEPTTHTRIISLTERMSRFLKIRLYWAIRYMTSIGLPMPSKARAIASGPVPVPPVSRDHFIAVMKNIDPSNSF